MRANRTTMLRRVGQRRGLTAEEVRAGNFINDEVNKDNAYRFMAPITGSPAYWEKAKKHVLAMIRQKGLPHIFLTMSMAETHWAELLVILKKAVDKIDITEEEANEMPFSEKARLIRNDPVTCALYFELRVKEIFKTFNVRGGPFGNRKVILHFYRIEFQHRGSPHIHMILWISDVTTFYPNNDDSGLDNLVNFLDETLSTDVNHPYAYFQKHKCGFTCKRIVRGQTVCRFNAPFMPMDETSILTPIPSDSALSAEEKKRYVLKHCWIHHLATRVVLKIS